MNDAELEDLKAQVKEEKKKLAEVPEPEMDLDKLSAAGDRVKREKKLKNLEKMAATEESLTEKNEEDLKAL